MRSRSRIAVIPFVLVLTGLTALVVTSIGSARARPKCFGQRATIVGSNGPNHISGTGGKDVIVTLGGNDTVKTPQGPKNQGKDLICTGPGDDEIVGNNDNEKFEGGPGNDDIKSGNGSNLLVGDNANVAGNESGPLGRDDLIGGQGRDFMVGDNYATGNASGGANDINFRAAAGGDVVVGDSASVGNGDATGGGNDRMGGASGNDLVVGDSYTKNGIAKGGGKDDNNSGPGQDLAVGDSFTKFGRTLVGNGPGIDELHAADGGDFDKRCRPFNSCSDVFYGDGYRAACAANRGVPANAQISVIRCEAQFNAGGGYDLLNTDQGDDFMNGGVPDPDGQGTHVDRCAGGQEFDIATRCKGIQTSFEREIPFP